MGYTPRSPTGLLDIEPTYSPAFEAAFPFSTYDAPDTWFGRAARRRSLQSHAQSHSQFQPSQPPVVAMGPPQELKHAAAMVRRSMRGLASLSLAELR